MRVTRHLLTLFIALTLLAGSLPTALSQGQLAVEKNVKLSRGKTKTLRGKTDSYTSYVYKVRAEKDRTLEARLTSDNNTATFSIVPPGTQTLENGAGVKEWTGVLPETGVYSIIVAVPGSASVEVPYTLQLTIQ